MMDSWHLFKIFHSRYISYFVFAFYTSVRADTPIITYSCLCYDIDCSRKHAICCICILHIIVSWSDFASPWLSDQPPIVGSASSVSRGPSKERLQSPLGAQRLGVQKPKNPPLVPCESGGFASRRIQTRIQYGELRTILKSQIPIVTILKVKSAWHNLNKSCLVSQFRLFCFRMLAEMIIRQFEGLLCGAMEPPLCSKTPREHKL